MDSIAVVNSLAPHIGFDFANLIWAVLVVVVPALYRILVSWANNRPTTWYWNALTKKFVLKRTDEWICKVFGRGVKDCNARYEDDLSDEAKQALKDHLIKKYPAILKIKIPEEK